MNKKGFLLKKQANMCNIICLKNDIIGHLVLCECHILTLPLDIQSMSPFNSLVLSPLTLLPEVLHNVSQTVVSRVLLLLNFLNFVPGSIEVTTDLQSSISDLFSTDERNACWLIVINLPFQFCITHIQRM